MANTTSLETKTTASATRHVPSGQDIAARPYEIFLSHGASDAHDLNDWLQAERELGAEIADTTKTRSARA